ncbi:hypothetical protein BO83DRAFT_445108 [Aspergillus eucalypticola CBS 122712]|uniref:Uncharacterized protein n=1 Tax=Aspergillus eucalypticola (strain CBS 122712 / IBT 29274) TaxID=1448314 RepID=A0A317VK97_ASPEC|nr:uncharacterized protein BO83DRAFT_445108 [Aspergillus eucalypticola CBS 122712]PWY73312.1 hypothetical protein BO83DRAFT_445108 [Aspergillus eucalypticola CBS 122712]
MTRTTSLDTQPPAPKQLSANTPEVSTGTCDPRHHPTTSTASFPPLSKAAWTGNLKVPSLFYPGYHHQPPEPRQPATPNSPSLLLSTPERCPNHTRSYKMKPVVSALNAWSCVVISVFAIVILSVLGSLYKSEHPGFTGSEGEPEDGAAVAASIFTAVLVYIRERERKNGYADRSMAGVGFLRVLRFPGLLAHEGPEGRGYIVELKGYPTLLCDF